MKLRYLAAVASAVTALLAPALPAFGADNGTVNAKVTVAAPCLTVSFTNPSVTALDFGTAPFQSSPAASRSLSNFFSVANCGASAENVSARGTNAVSATSTASWALEGTPLTSRCSTQGPNTYYLTTELTNPTNTGWLPTTFLSTSDQTVASAVSPGSRPVTVSLAMPCPGSAGAGETMNFQFIYTASL